MVVFGRTQRTWKCFFGKRILCKYGRKRRKKLYVRGHWIDFSREEINKLFNLGVKKDGSKFRKQLRETEH